MLAAHARAALWFVGTAGRQDPTRVVGVGSGSGKDAACASGG